MGIVSGGGGGGSSSFKVHGPFNFHYNTAGLADGIEAITLPAGDVLLDIWCEITTAWNGTTPQGDVGGRLPFGADLTYNGLYSGAFGFPMDMTKAAIAGSSNNSFYGAPILRGAVDLLHASIAGLVYDILEVPAIGSTPSAQQRLVRLGMGSGFLVIPMRLVAESAFHVCVSQTGQSDGSDPGASQGEANLYFVTATPTAIA